MADKDVCPTSRLWLLFLCGLLLVLSGCRLAEREAVTMLPEGALVPYAELLERAKLQVSVATEAFYTDDWPALKKAALALEQTARHFPKATETPASVKKDLPARAVELEKAALQLLQDTQAKDVIGANARLQTINLKIRAFVPVPTK